MTGAAAELEMRIRARKIAAGYAGNYPFMVDVRLRALRYPSWLPTVAQAAAIIRCANRDQWTQPALPEPDPTLTRRQQAALDREARYLSGRL